MPERDAFGPGDLLVRAKYVLRRGWPFDLAAGLGLSLPTGSQDDLQGRGTTLVAPALIASTVIADRIEPLVNLGVDCDTSDVSRSAVRWAAGATARLAGPFTAAVVFLGRYELGAPSDPIATPFFFQISRSNVVDASVGARWRFSE